MSDRIDPRSPSARLSAVARQPRGSRRTGAGNTLIGVFIGVVLGLALAAGVAFYLMRSGSPYQATTGAAKEPARDASIGRAAKADKDAGKPKFDFYKILPSGEDPKVQAKAPERSSDRATVDRAMTQRDEAASAKAPANAEAKPADRFWLQAGSFSTQDDADNLKARLALAGWEASVQEADVPDKGVRYRVRMGPFDNTDELTRIKGELAKRGFDVAVIKF
jgi:cell division protein FtsN